MNVAYNQDCITAMQSMPDKAFDLAVVDPPYGINITKMKMGSRRTICPDSREWDRETPGVKYFDELFRVSKDQIIFGGNYFKLPPSRCFVVWDKGESMYGRSFAEVELAWTSFDKSARIFKHSPNDPCRIHPTQKPVALYAWIFSRFAKPGDKILDTHLGSGSSRIAAWDAGLDFVGYEIDTEYFNAQEKRFRDYTAQTNLFLTRREM